jgi:hypothetical protein
MAISGLVVTLAEDDAAADAAVTMLEGDPRLTLGERFGRRLALVADTPSVHADRALWDELRGNPGITNVDVTFVHLDAEPASSEDQGQDTPVEDHRAHA